MAYIFYPRVETMAADGDASLADILGHAMAHEIGHLLLGPSQPPVGIMRPSGIVRTLRGQRSTSSGLHPSRSSYSEALPSAHMTWQAQLI
jgi:hypothetical protein